MYSLKSGTKTAADNDESNTLIKAIKSKEGPLLGVCLTIPSLVCSQIAGNSGSEIAMIDMEHSPLSAESATQMVHAVVSSSRGACFPVIRVPSHDVEWIKWALDSGAAGIIIPMVNNAVEVEAIIDRAIYPPRGRRSFGPVLAPFGHPDGPHGGMAEYIQRAERRDIAILPMIESREGVENAEAILSCDGVSGVFIGPYDLRLSLGLPGGIDGDEPEFLGALENIVSLGKKLGKIVGSMGMGTANARRRAADGMDFLLATSDYASIASGFAKELADARKGVQGASIRSFL